MKWIKKHENKIKWNKIQNHTENNEYILVFIIKEIEARTKYVQPQYETLRKLVSTRSLVVSWKKAFRTCI